MSSPKGRDREQGTSNDEYPKTRLFNTKRHKTTKDVKGKLE